MVNKPMIIMHIIAYLALIIVNVLAYFFYFGTSGAYEISAICNLAVYSVCTLIFGLIVN
jgi:hypothetical protein